MKKFFPYILIPVVLVLVLTPTHLTHAIWGVDVFPAPGEFVLNILTVIIEGVLSLLSWILWLAGTLLNYVLDYTVVNLTDRLTGLDGINISWKIIRDLMNICFIFILVYEGILLILDMGSLQNIKKFIFGVVLASLLINFSLFFTRVLIDASNVVTVGIYNSIIGDSSCSTDQNKNCGLSDKIMNSLGLQTIYGSGQKAGYQANFGANQTIGGLLVMGIGSGILIIVSSFVFFAVSVMFIVRYLTIIFLLMLSPIAYMGIAISSLNTYSKEWWESLKGQLLFPPIFMVMMLIVLTLMTSKGFITVSSFSAILSTENGTPPFDTMNLILNFAVIIGLIIAALVTSKKWAKMGSSYIGEATKSLTSFAGGAVFGGGARLGRNTFGRLGNSMTNNQDLLDRAAKGDRFAKAQLAIANKAATSTFDARGSYAFGKVAGSAGMGKDFGKADDPKKQNYRKIREEQIKKEVDDAKKYKPSDLAVEEAKAKLNTNTEEGRRFRNEEEARKQAHDAYVQSDDYKNSAQYKQYRKTRMDNQLDKTKLAQQRAEIENSEKKLLDLRKQRDDYADNTPQKAKINSEIDALEKDTLRKKNLADDLGDLVNRRSKEVENYEFEEKNYMSDELKKTIALAGGQKQKKDRNGNAILVDGRAVDQDGRVMNTNAPIKSSYAQRVEDRAKREEAGAIWRWSENVIGTPLSAVIPMKPKTKSDRSEIARQIRKLAEEKSKKEKLADLAKEVQTEEDDSKPKEETPEPAAPESTPSPKPDEPK